MIVKSHYWKTEGQGFLRKTWEIESWKLFGFIPLYTIKKLREGTL